MLRLRDDAIAWKEVDGEVLLLDLTTSTYLSVNPSATLLWRRLADGTTEDDLVDALVGEYELDRAAAVADVQAFLDDCRARALLLDDGA